MARRLVMVVCGVLWYAVMATAQSSPYRINSIEFIIDGATQEFALYKAVPTLKTGETFDTLAEVDAYLQEQLTKLRNIRQLQTVTMSYSTAGTAVDVEFMATDSINFSIYPTGGTDTNTGSFVGLGFSNLNFAGTLESLGIAAGYYDRLDAHDVIITQVLFDLPLLIDDQEYIFNGFGQVNIPTEPDAGIELAFSTAFGIVVPFYDETTIELSLLQSVEYTTLTEGDSVLDELPVERYYLTSGARFRTLIDTGIRSDALGMLTYAPVLSVFSSYRFDQPVLYDRRGLVLRFDHTARFQNFNWIANLREGSDIIFFNSNRLNTLSGAFYSLIQTELRGYAQAAEIVGLSGRVGWAHYIPLFDADDTFLLPLHEGGSNDTNEVGQFSRGIVNDTVSGGGTVFGSVDFLFGNLRNGGILELQFGLFSDVLVVYDYQKTDDTVVLPTAGFQVLFFLLPFRTVYLRMAQGYDIRQSIAQGALGGEDASEFSFSFGHAY